MCRSAGAGGPWPSRAVAVLVAVLLLAAFPALAADGTVFSGFVDASGTGDLTARTGTFGLDQTEIDVVRAVNERCTVRADLEWVKDGEGWIQDVEQGFLTYRFGGARGLEATLGKFNAPMGFESLDPVDMYQFSHALVFDYGLPTNLTGLLLARPLSERWRLTGWWVNGWDRDDTTDRPRTFGGRLDLDAGSSSHAGVSVITGQEWRRSDLDPADPAYVAPFRFRRTVVDVDGSFRPSSSLLLGVELNRGRYKRERTAQDWTGLLLMAHQDVNDWWGWTGRFGWLKDDSGRLFGARARRSAMTLASTFDLGEGAGALVEVRYDHVSRELWQDGDGAPTDHRVTAAFETTYSF